MLCSMVGYSITSGNLHNVLSQYSHLGGDDMRHDIDNMLAYIICMYTIYIYNFFHSITFTINYSLQKKSLLY